MIRLLPILVTGAILAASLPATGLAASTATNKQIARTFQQLKRLPDAASPSPRVRQLVRKLTVLNPKATVTYYKLGLRKLEPANAEQAARQILRVVIAVVNRTDLPENQLIRITRIIKKTANRYVPPTPTPTPYQAAVPRSAPAIS
jgi:hypothetical protein